MKIINFLKKKYNRLLDKIFQIIKKTFIQKFILILVFSSSIILFIGILGVSIKVYKFTWYFLPWYICLATIAFFFIIISVFFFKNLNLFDYFIQKLLIDFIKPWLLPLIIFFFCLGFYFIYYWFKLPNIFYFIAIIPIIPIYLIKNLFAFYSTSTDFPSSAWATLFSLIIIIPFIIYLFNIIGKRILSNCTIDRNKNNLQLLKNFTNIKINIKKSNLKKKIFLLWWFSVILCFFSLFNSYFGYDTPSYYVYVKDYQDNGNLNLLFNQKYYKLGIMNLPVVILLIFFTFICGGDIILGSVLMHTIIFSLMPPFITLITFNITKDDRIAIWAGIIFMFSGAVQVFLRDGILKQFVSIFIIIIILYMLLYTNKKKWKEKIAQFTAISLIIIQSLFYIYFLSLIYLIVTQYFLRKKKINFSILKNDFIFKILKFFIFFILINIILLFFLFGFFSNFFKNIFSIPLNSFAYSIIVFSQFRDENEFFLVPYEQQLLYSCLLGISLIFAIIGIHFDFKKKIIHNKRVRTFLILLFECSFVFIFLGIFGFNIIEIRMIFYTLIPVSIFGAIGICKVKDIFPKIWSEKRNVQKHLELILLSLLICNFFLGVSYLRNSVAIPEEIDAMDWFKDRDDYDLLINKNKTDIQIISNAHLMYWIQYKIHYNALIIDNIKGLRDLDLEMLADKDYRKYLREKADIKLYIFISKNKEFSTEQWELKDLIKFFEEYRIYYNFNWNNYSINKVVTIWEISYV